MKGSWTAGLCAALLLAGFFSSGAIAGGGTCAKAEFEAVVDDAAAALRDLNNKNRPVFQERLRALKDKRGWSNDEFMKEAAPFVKDDEIEVFDDKSNELLANIASMGQEGSAAATPDCNMLSSLKAQMQVLVDTQTAKWSYMFAKLEKALAQ
jgi:hypothetical protein